MYRLIEPGYYQKIEERFRKRNLNKIPSFSAFSDYVRWDFCCGLRIYIRDNQKEKYIVEIADFSKNIKLYKIEMTGGDYFVSPARYFQSYSFRITNSAGDVFEHTYNAKDQKVFIDIPFDAMGDAIAWFTAAVQFQKKHNCKLYVRIPEFVKCLFEPVYPDITFLNNSEKQSIENLYANYQICIYPEGDSEIIDYPVDYRAVSLHEYGALILGLDKDDVSTPPDIAYSEECVIQDFYCDYVCISSHASALCKHWLNPSGWDEVVDFLHKSGYIVLDIDKEDIVTYGFVTTRIPRDADDLTGDMPLTARAAQIKGADFFIGLGSGLSWLAWCCKKPVVLISGFSEPHSEFDTPYRVQNSDVCHGCYNDMRIKCVIETWDWCPKKCGTEKHFECSRKITAKMVIDTIKTMPEYIKHLKKFQREKELENELF